MILNYTIINWTTFIAEGDRSNEYVTWTIFK